MSGGGWIVPQDEIRGSEVGLAVQQQAQIQKALINITALKHFWESCLIYLIHYLGNSTKYQIFVGCS